MSKPHKCKWRPFRGTVDFPTDGRVVCDEGCGRQLSAREVCVLLNAPKVKYAKVGEVAFHNSNGTVCVVPGTFKPMQENTGTSLYVRLPRKVRI